MINQLNCSLSPETLSANYVTNDLFNCSSEGEDEDSVIIDIFRTLIPRFIHERSLPKHARIKSPS